jgi:thiamine pyrophosphokinase
MKRCLIIANGRPPQKSVIAYLRHKGYSTIICADGGADSIRKLSIIPDFIIGDLDSISKENLEYFSTLTIVKRINRQNDTDVEKCLKFAIKNGFNEAVLLGVTGNRLDHSFCNLGIAIKFSEIIKINIISEDSFLSVHSDLSIINTHPGETISIYGFDEKTLITSKGLKYKLSKTALPFGKKESTSNVSLKNKVVLEIKNGKVFVIRDFQTIKKYDLI